MRSSEVTWSLDLSAQPVTAAADLDPDQRMVVEHRSGPLLVLAGPGTGKTTTIVEAMCARISDPHDPIRPDQVLGLTFGRKAANELRDRVTARLGGGLVPTVATFHSFAYALICGTASGMEYLDPPRLLSGAEEDVRIRELLRGAIEDGSIDWPDDLMGAVDTLGLANEVRAVLSRARELGMEEDALVRVGRASGRSAWAAVGQLGLQEQQVMAMENVIDYTELLYRAVVRLNDPRALADMRNRFRAIFVDEYQDTDRLQVKMLKALVGPATSIVAVGDPDQAIYGFRGADTEGIVNFGSDFPMADGTAPPTIVLGHTRRFGPVIRQVATKALGTRALPGLAPEDRIRHRNPSCVAATDPDSDVVTLRYYDSRSTQAANVAAEIRQAHLNRGVPWQEMAVLVRSGNQLPAIQRALISYGVPAVVAADEIPLRSEPSVAVLLSALRLALAPDDATSVQVIDLLLGPMCQMTPSDVRRLGRALRTRDHQPGFASPASDELIRQLVVTAAKGQPVDMVGIDEALATSVERIGCLIASAHALIRRGATPAEVLWELWNGGSWPHGWPERLRRAALNGSRTADHDLDAVMSLFDSAERYVTRREGFGKVVSTFLATLEDQEIPAEAVADRGTRSDAVRVLTAHRAKGLEWDEVWVVGLEEGVWPDLRERGSTLRAQELTTSGVGPGPSSAQLMEEERRLLFVACTRPRHQLHLSAVSEADDAGDRPSRFLADIARAIEPTLISGRPSASVTLDALVVSLRRAAQDVDTPAEVRSAAIERLAHLAAAVDDDGVPLVPLANPNTWWGLADMTPGAQPVRDPDKPISMSGSSLDSLIACPRKWFLEHEVHAETQRGTATAFGSIVHAIADFVAKGELPADLDAMDAQVDRVWPELRFEARWQSEAERSQAHDALSRFLEYHRAASRELVGTEESVGTVIEVPRPDGQLDSVRLTGFIDRVERDDQGRLVAIDLKNMKRIVPPADVPDHGQLGIYQLILKDGGMQSEPDASVGGAALVQLRVPESKGSPAPKEQLQPALDGPSPTWVEIRLGEAAQLLRTEEFSARPSRDCTYCAYAHSCPAQSVGGQVTP